MNSLTSCQELFDLARHLPEHSSEDLKAALEDKVNATRTLVSSFVRLGEQSPFRLFDNNNYLEAQKTTTAVISLSDICLRICQVTFLLGCCPSIRSSSS
jgi:hypothetical protein